jgi:coenzyme PQQ precursor peptide PqqA
LTSRRTRKIRDFFLHVYPGGQIGSRPVYGAFNRAHHFSLSFTGGYAMQWTTPQFTDLRFGFEITMYIATR